MWREHTARTQPDVEWRNRQRRSKRIDNRRNTLVVDMTQESDGQVHIRRLNPSSPQRCAQPSRQLVSDLLRRGNYFGTEFHRDEQPHIVSLAGSGSGERAAGQRTAVSGQR